jgi:Cu(I)/Ag(I) efflux system membrane fusion protein
MKCEGEKLYEVPGTCPVCEMKLEPSAPAAAGTGILAVPLSAVLDSGTRRIVFVEKSRGLFEPREVVVGPRTEEHFPILQGLSEGERVVVRGGFLIDSQFQITGHPSLFFPGGLQAGAAHAHAMPGASGAAPEAPAPPPMPPGHKH